MYVVCSTYWHMFSLTGTLIDFSYCSVRTCLWRISHSLYSLSLFLSWCFIHYSRVHYCSFHSLSISTVHPSYAWHLIMITVLCVSPSSRYISLSVYFMSFVSLTSLLQSNLYVHYLENYLQYLLLTSSYFLCRRSCLITSYKYFISWVLFDCIFH